MRALHAPEPEPSVQLTLDRIIYAALLLIQSDGVEKLTMRSLAKSLGVAPGATYYYVSGKDELIRLVTQSIVDAMKLPSEGSWQSKLRETFRVMLQTFGDFPGTDSLTGSPQVWDTAAARPTAHMVALLTEAGVPAAKMDQALDVVTLFSSGALRHAELYRRLGLGKFVETPAFDVAGTC